MDTPEAVEDPTVPPVPVEPSGSERDAATNDIEVFLGAKKAKTIAVPITLEAGHPVEFVFQALGRQAYEDFKADERFQPTKAQKDAYYKAMVARRVPRNQIPQLPHNTDTYPPALIARCCISHPMTEEQAIRLWNNDQMGEAELADLFDAALLVNNIRAQVTLGNA